MDLDRFCVTRLAAALSPWLLGVLSVPFGFAQGRLWRDRFGCGLRPELMRFALCGYRRGDGWLSNREPSRLEPRIPAGSGELQKPIRVRPTHHVGPALPAGTPNAINAVLRPPSSILHPWRSVASLGALRGFKNPGLRSSRSGGGTISSGRDRVCAAVEKAKRGASKKFFTPSGPRSCATSGPREIGGQDIPHIGVSHLP